MGSEKRVCFGITAAVLHLNHTGSHTLFTPTLPNTRQRRQDLGNAGVETQQLRHG